MEDQEMPEMAQEQSEQDTNAQLASKLQEAKSLLEGGQVEPAMQIIDECISVLGGAEQAQSEEMAQQGQQPDFKEALNSAFS